MKKKFILSGLLFLAFFLISQMIATDWKSNKNYNQASITEQDWETSPAFSIGERTMIGQPSKIGISDTDFIAGKQKGVHWFLWGDKETLVKSTFKLTAKSQEVKPINIVENYGIAYGTDGVDAQVPTLVTIPSPGLWKFNAFVDNKLYGSIVIRVTD